MPLQSPAVIASASSYVSSIVRGRSVSMFCFRSQGHFSLNSSIILTSRPKALFVSFIMEIYTETTDNKAKITKIIEFTVKDNRQTRQYLTKVLNLPWP